MSKLVDAVSQHLDSLQEAPGSQVAREQEPLDEARPKAARRLLPVAKNLRTALTFKAGHTSGKPLDVKQTEFVEDIIEDILEKHYQNLAKELGEVRDHRGKDRKPLGFIIHVDLD